MISSTRRTMFRSGEVTLPRILPRWTSLEGEGGTC